MHSLVSKSVVGIVSCEFRAVVLNIHLMIQVLVVLLMVMVGVEVRFITGHNYAVSMIFTLQQVVVH